MRSPLSRGLRSPCLSCACSAGSVVIPSPTKLGVTSIVTRGTSGSPVIRTQTISLAQGLRANKPVAKSPEAGTRCSGARPGIWSPAQLPAPGARPSADSGRRDRDRPRKWPAVLPQGPTDRGVTVANVAKAFAQSVSRTCRGLSAAPAVHGRKGRREDSSACDWLRRGLPWGPPQ